MSVISRIKDKLKNNLETSGGHNVYTSGSKVVRYRAGQKPEYAENDNDDDNHFSNIQNQKSIKEAETNDPRLNRFKSRPNITTATTTTTTATTTDERKASRRRHHDDDNDDENDGDINTDNKNNKITITERRIQKTEIIKDDDNGYDITTNKNDNNDNDDDDDDRRKRAKERYLKNKKEEEEREKQKELNQHPFKDVEGEGDDDENGSGSSEEGSSEYETDDDDDENDNEYWNQQPTFRPTFVKKEQRGTIKTDQQWEKEEKEYQAQLERENEQRKIEAHRKLKEELDRDRVEQESKELQDKEEEEYENDQDEDGKKFDAWVEREIERIRLEIRSRLLIDFDKKELERRRKMTDEQILSEDPSRIRNTDKQKQLKFLQRDYHRGAFFQDDEYIKNKDFSAPTGDDKFNRQLLPEIMQVKNFGKAGRTKYTHLKDQDTSSKDSYWSKDKNENNKKYSGDRDHHNDNNKRDNNRDYRS